MAIQFAKIEGCEVSGVSRKEKHLEVAKNLELTMSLSIRLIKNSFCKM
uniref:Uncharacterized protein n=1 Tax=uncultured marine thaumarchaeote AD1000_50_E11 TaxID=1455923 RepID=A0A075FYU0_9ARCH|nr:hypothetical protein [uncultured marine thaumarchaeote AD1000_50_E11]